MKKLKYLIIIMMIFLGIKNIYALNNFDNTKKIYDYAQILTDKEESKLKHKVNDYINKYNIDMVVITVKYYDQTTTDEYIKAFYNKNNFGKGSFKDGIIIAIDLKANNTSIKTFGTASNYYSEIEINNIIKNVDTKENYYKKLETFINYSNQYVKQSDDNYIQSVNNNFLSLVSWYAILIPSLIVPTVVICIGIFKNKTVRKQTTANYYINTDSIIINISEDKFVTTNTKKVIINKK